MQTNPSTPNPVTSIDTVTAEILDFLQQLQLTSQRLLDQSTASINNLKAQSEKALEHLKAMREQGHLIVSQQKDHYKAIEALGLEYFHKVATDAGGAQAELFGERILAGYQSVMNKTTDKILEAASQLQNLLHKLRWRVIGLFGAVMIPICITVGLFLNAWKLDTTYTIDKQQAQQAQIEPILQTLKNQGKKLDVRPCPFDRRQRLCVRVDPNANRYGYRQEYAVID